MVESFSGTHPFRPACLVAQMIKSLHGQDSDEELRLYAVDQVANLVQIVDSGRCPRCADPFADPPVLPAGSRVTRCRCVPVCGPCGFDETYVLLSASDWPISEEEVDERRRRQGAMRGLGAIGTRLSGGGIGVITEDGVVTIPPALPHPGGGWAELGYDDGPDREERTGR